MNKREWEDKKKQKNKTMLTEGRKKEKRKNMRMTRNYVIYAYIPVSFSKRQLRKKKICVFGWIASNRLKIMFA
jgi:hypothetical protein